MGRRTDKTLIFVYIKLNRIHIYATLASHLPKKKKHQRPKQLRGWHKVRQTSSFIEKDLTRFKAINSKAQRILGILRSFQIRTKFRAVYMHGLEFWVCSGSGNSKSELKPFKFVHKIFHSLRVLIFQNFWLFGFSNSGSIFSFWKFG